MTKIQVLNFMGQLRRKVYGDPNKRNGGVMSAGLVADHLGITEDEAVVWLWAAVDYGFSDRQGGAFVV